MRYILTIGLMLIASLTFAQSHNDTITVQTDTLQEVEVRENKELPVVDAIRKSIGAGMKMPGKKGISDYINTDKILHPFAYKQRRREKNKKATKKNLEQYDRIKTFEEQLTEAIHAQMVEDSLEAVRKANSSRQ